MPMAENMSANLATRSLELRRPEILSAELPYFRYYWKYRTLASIKRSRALLGVSGSKTGPTQTWVTADGGLRCALF